MASATSAITLPDAEAPRPRRWRPAAAYWGTAALHGAALAGAALQPAWWPWLLGGCALNHVAVASLAFLPANRLLGPVLARLPNSAPRDAVALTFDDGPDPAITPQVLDLLDAHQARATFFCVGEQARRHPQLVRQIVARGHAVENHSMHHGALHGFLLPGQLAREISAAQAAISDLTGAAPVFFRPPFGVRTPATEPVLSRLGLHCAQWSIRSLDAIDRDAIRVARRVTSRLSAGDIVLLHDGLATGGRRGPPSVLSALPLILQAMNARGLRSLTLRHACAAVQAA
jgi:peptidoglycan-N-acetylglucosamine deacetylase